MKRGQISIDLLITLIIVIMIIGAFTIILSGFQSGQEEFFVRTQLRENSSALASFITSTNSISDATFTTQLMIQNINYKNISMQPIIDIDTDTNYIILMFDIGEKIVEEKSFFSNPPSSTITKNGRLLVVSNE